MIDKKQPKFATSALKKSSPTFFSNFILAKEFKNEVNITNKELAQFVIDLNLEKLIVKIITNCLIKNLIIKSLLSLKENNNQNDDGAEY